ncbi:MAG: alanine racemase [Geminicoccaceae bacterium]|uniref:alanine racemase n=1 Tax=Reyranella sp. TaxID=1929291 RepID=UPI003D13FAF7
MRAELLPSLRPNRLVCDLAAVADNLQALRRKLRPGTRIFAALKGDAYGFGLQQVAAVLVEGGVDGIAVADQADAIALRDRGIRIPLLLYAGHLASRETVQATLSHDLIPTLVDAGEAAEYARLATRPLDVFVKVDVGLERIGVPAEQAADFVTHVRSLPNLRVSGLYTHLQVPANATDGFLRWQAGRFDAVVAALARTGAPMPLRMLASSASLVLVAGIEYDAVDPGGLLFGSRGAAAPRIDFGVRPVLDAITSRILQVKAAISPTHPDQMPFPWTPGMRFAVLPLGTRDGLPRFSAGRVLIRGRSAAILGSISIEHVRVDVSDIPDAAPGDEAVIVGRQGDAEIPFSEVMTHCGHRRLADLAMAVAPTIPRVGAR